ncbi:MAG: DUF2264 domain-containing protein [Verrucomicrobiota bacterium]|nr:DUF2264 domain-containing protein [Verrucomicrobiota bacterium]
MSISLSRTGAEDRATWYNLAYTVARPVLAALAAGKLRSSMPVELSPECMTDEHEADDRAHYSHLEALARTLAGIAPWLALTNTGATEDMRRQEILLLTRASLAQAVDPKSPDCMNFIEGAQCLVDAAFLAQAFLRATAALWDPLDPAVQKRYVVAFKSTRRFLPHHNNWLLFSAIIETFLHSIGEDYDAMRIDYAVRQHIQWYKGDGVYGDGQDYRWDYYNSFVIQPMLLDIVGTSETDKPWRTFQPMILQRARRYAIVLEHMISPEGALPVIGRSLCYRMGALQLLAQIALMRELPKELAPGQVRAAITAVSRRLMEAPNTYTDEGWLRLGFCGHQPSLAEPYISTGSLYLCLSGLLPLGLPPSDVFWAQPAAAWTSLRIYAGEDTLRDTALYS